MSKNLVKAGILLFILSTVSKLLGFLRETFLAYYYGTSYESDAYFIALTPSTLAITFSLSLSSVFLPLFVKYMSNKKEAYRFTNNIITMFFIVTGILYLSLFMDNSPIIKLLAPGLPPESEALSIQLLKVLFPLVFIVICIQLFTDMLNSYEKFLIPALSILPNNAIIIIYLLVYGKSLGIIGIAVVTLISFIIQFLLLYSFLRREKYSFSFTKKFLDENTKGFMLLAMPVIVSSLFSQLNAVVDRLLASTLSEGSISSLMYAYRLKSMVIGIFISALITISFPKVSKLANNLKRKELIELTKENILLIFLVVGPVSAYLMLFGSEIVEILFQRGAFGEEAKLATGGVFFYYSLGLVFVGVRELVLRNFYALGNTKTPTVILIISLVLNMILSYLFVSWFGLYGLGLSSSVGIIISVWMLTNKLKNYLPNIWDKNFVAACVKVSLSLLIAAMAIKAILIYSPLFAWESNQSIIFKLIILIIYFVLFTVVYLGVLLGIRDKQITRFFTKFLPKKGE